MTRSKILVLEKSGDWAVALRRAFSATQSGCSATTTCTPDDQFAGQAPLEPRVWETRSLPELYEELAAAPASFVALEGTFDNLQSLPQTIEDLSRPWARAVIVLTARDLSLYAPLWREAGAVHVAVTTRRLEPVARMARRHLARFPAADDGPIAELWRRLPLAGG